MFWILEKNFMITDFFDPIQLEEMEKVKLMNRTDRKYWFHFDFLPELLQTIKHDYYILNIDGKNQLPYTTTYYDTTKNKMYASHHNGKLNRFKIRRRSYVASRISFLEIKFKSNKGRTIKKRIPADFNNLKFTRLLLSIIPQIPHMLKPMNHIKIKIYILLNYNTIVPFITHFAQSILPEF